MMQKDRDPSFDAFRGLAIIAVVATHAAQMGFSIRNTPGEKWNFSFLVAYCQLLDFCIPAFLFISGYWISKKSIKSLEDYKKFLITRFSRILVPYFFWSVILLGYAAVREHKIDMYQIIFKLMTGRAAAPYYPYYFIIVLAQLYMITPILQRINRKSYGLISIIILNVLGLLVLYLSRLKLIWHHPITLPFYLWIIFYEIGLLVGRRTSEMFPPKKIRSLILPCLLVSIVIMELEGYVIISKFSDTFFAVSITRYSSFLYSVFVILGFLVLRERIRRWPQFLVVLGKYSFGIYLIHTSVLNQVINLIQKNNAICSFQLLFQITAVLITLLICFVLINVTRKLLPESFCHKVLGF